MGRRAKTPAEKKLCGSRVRKKNPHPDTSTTDSSRCPGPDVPSPPGWLVDAFARAEWTRLAADLVSMRILSPIDSINLAMLCQATATYVRAQQVVAEKGATYTTASKHGEMDRVRPEVKIAAEAEKTILRITKEFGLAPLSRARVATAHANNGVQLMLPGFDIAPSVKSDDQTASQGTSQADTFFGYGTAPVH
ncbi:MULTISPECIES: phage terminase small subunit P27 family [unclassified Haematospirillum]|uniref:phage terminase small subunit P27 family n=1 Tax=unclassified Haematospirillum TaxID=2622088 RepID=UPI00143BF5B0|nr:MULTISPECIES: phage terminase small subunit P27 family [unclassified Haematospirillum]NKD55961.1 phage terminase small subunit P27 family [Haematospirillum sp. H4890]NKD75268.1 phage terminase small subunit P27 family [Haematospirillum sp. H4485]